VGASTRCLIAIMTDTGNSKILIVEDDELWARSLSLFLTKNGFSVETETCGDKAVARILASNPAAVVLDGFLPGKDGFEVCLEVRAAYRGIIVLLTARDDEINHVLGLELGADDYIAKPAQPSVVLARLRAHLRRVVPPVDAEPDQLTFGRFRISQAARTVHLREAEISFTSTEFDLLWLLASNAGAILSRDDIQSAMRGIEHDGVDRSIDMRISRLRKRLGDDADTPMHIKTIRAKGYLFSTEPWQ
jgi:two-component system, OmpR family, response regulator